MDAGLVRAISQFCKVRTETPRVLAACVWVRFSRFLQFLSFSANSALLSLVTVIPIQGQGSKRIGIVKLSRWSNLADFLALFGSFDFRPVITDEAEVI